MKMRVWGCAAALALIAYLNATAFAAEETALQSYFMTGDQKTGSSSWLMKAVHQYLKDAYEDLEIVVTSCKSGEFASRAGAGGGLAGTWSLLTATDEKHNSLWYERTGTGPIFSGWAPYYTTAVQTLKNTKGSKDLWTKAKNDSDVPERNPRYNSSGAASDAFTIHGGANSNHAILFSVAEKPTTVLGQYAERMYKGLTLSGYTDGTIDYLRGKALPDPQGTVDRVATAAELTKAMKDMAAAIGGATEPDREKAYIFIQAHGGYAQKTVHKSDGRRAPSVGPGSGQFVNNSAGALRLIVDDPTALGDVLEELPKPASAGGGFWADDPELTRYGDAVLSISTNNEFFATANTNVGVSVNGHPIGSITMGDSQGGDYDLPIPSDLLGELAPDLLASQSLQFQFAFPTSADYFQTSVAEDYALDSYTHLDYGMYLATPLNVFDPETAIPEPCAAFATILAATTLFLRRTTRSAR